MTTVIERRPLAGATWAPQPAGIRHRWWWVEHSVWTDRRLIRLEESEPSAQWFRLSDKVLSERNLQAAFLAVWRNDGAPGLDNRGFGAEGLFGLEHGSCAYGQSRWDRHWPESRMREKRSSGWEGAWR
jgi:hypothetical protein